MTSNRIAQRSTILPTRQTSGFRLRVRHWRAGMGFTLAMDALGWLLAAAVVWIIAEVWL